MVFLLTIFKVLQRMSKLLHPNCPSQIYYDTHVTIKLGFTPQHDFASTQIIKYEQS